MQLTYFIDSGFFLTNMCKKKKKVNMYSNNIDIHIIKRAFKIPLKKISIGM